MAENITEFSPEDEAEEITDPIDDFGQAVLWGTDWTVETVLAQLRRGNIELNPRFQRRDAWSKTAKSRFVESIILGLPIPQVVLAESRDQRGRYIILDGKQRLLSLMQFAGLAEGENNAFGLSALEVRTDLRRKKYHNLESDVNLRPELDAFLTHTIRTTVIRNWPSISFLHIVFQRLNTGSLKLSPQELRQAIVPGPFTDFADDFTAQEQPIQRLLGSERPDPRMRDVELLVRAIAFKGRLSRYRGRMKDFLDETCQDFNGSWNETGPEVQNLAREFSQGVQALEAIFGVNGIARKQGSRLFNRSVFDALSYYAMDLETREQMLMHQGRVLEAYSQLIAEDRFQEAVESDTAGIPNTVVRLQMWGESLSAALDRQLAIPQLVEEPNNRFIRP